MGSKSSSSQTSNTIDRRVVVQDGVGISGDGNALNVTDGGIVSRGLDTVDTALSGALNSINVNNATNADSFTKLLSAAENLWDRGEKLIGQTQQSVADAYSRANDDKAGTIDNRTIIVLAVAGAAALAFVNRK